VKAREPLAKRVAGWVERRLERCNHGPVKTAAAAIRVVGLSMLLVESGCGGSTQVTIDASSTNDTGTGTTDAVSATDADSSDGEAAEAGVECGDAACRPGQYCAYSVGGGPPGVPTTPPTPITCVDIHTSWCDASQCQCFLPDPCPAGTGTCLVAEATQILCGGL
jgi:hypothetical protein